jgi:endo-1,4-beta-xylanase
VPGLKDLGALSGHLIGSVVQVGYRMIPQYEETLVREFNFVVPEEATIWLFIEPTRGNYSFGLMDLAVNQAEAARQRIRGEPIVDNQPTRLPGWLNATLSAADLQTVMEDHVRLIVERYRGRVAEWVVVHEGVAQDGSLRNSLFLQKLGSGYIADAFRIAHAADPDAILIYNDYAADGVNPKSDGVYNLMKDLLQQGVPVHGVGLEMHVGGVFDSLEPIPTTVRENIRRFADLGLQVFISEIDVELRNFPGDETAKLERQREVYHDIVADCLAERGCKSINFWGFTDKYSWINNPVFGICCDEPCPFDANYLPKPAYSGVNDALLQR